MKKLLGIFIALAITFTAAAKPVTHLGSATEAMTHAEYWNADTTLIKTLPQIQAYNRSLLAQKELHIRIVSQEENAKMFGLVVRPTNIRNMPTHKITSANGKKNGPKCFDKYQESSLMPGAEVAVMRDTCNGEWVWVHAWNYEGWVDANDIAQCTREQMREYAQQEPFVVTLSVSDEHLFGEKMRINAGTRLPLLSGGKVLMPRRGKDGKLLMDSTTLQGDTHIGYVPLSAKAILDIAYRQLGNPYSWGDLEKYNDCSGLAESTYRCFGVMLPRNVKWMRKVEIGNTHVEDQHEWKGLHVGDILLSQSHAMIYVGNENGEPYIIHATCGYKNAKGKNLVANATVVTSMSDLYKDVQKKLTLRDKMLNILTLY